MIVATPLDFVPVSVFVKLQGFSPPGVAIYLKSEMFNPAGSIKFKPAVRILKDLEARRVLVRGGGIIDTTSGNMGIALSVAAKARGYTFTCVCDEKVTTHNRALLQAYGTELVILPGSTLRERYAYIERRVRETPSLVWTRQFTNPVNPRAHEDTTAQEILREIPNVTHLFVGTGTAGTLSGCARALKARGSKVRLIAVDPVGSFHFRSTGESCKRLLPGIGASERSPFLDEVELHGVAIVAERDAVSACRALVERTGWLFGASSGSVFAAIQSSLHSFRDGDVVIGTAADSGERYLECVYNDDWVAAHFPGLLGGPGGCDSRQEMTQGLKAKECVI